MNFIKNVGPSVFPSQLQSGRILYYNSIPSSINTSTWPPTDLNQRFWKDYIDYVLGVMQVSSNQYVVISNGSNGLTGYGNDFQWGTAQITPRNNLSGNPTPYMQYGDNPLRPTLSFWFGPMTMVDFLGNYNLWYTGYGNDCSRYCWWPGTCHESPTYECKLGVQAALNDMQNNHPNDQVSLIMFSTPLTSSNDTGADRFNRVRGGAEPELLHAHRLALVPAGDRRQPQRHGQPLRFQQPDSAAGDGGHLLFHGTNAGLQPVQRQLGTAELQHINTAGRLVQRRRRRRPAAHRRL